MLILFQPVAFRVASAEGLLALGADGFTLVFLSGAFAGAAAGWPVAILIADSSLTLTFTFALTRLALTLTLPFGKALTIKLVPLALVEILPAVRLQPTLGGRFARSLLLTLSRLTSLYTS